MATQAPDIDVISLGVGAAAELGARAAEALCQAEHVVGSPRQLTMVGHFTLTGETRALPLPLTNLTPLLAEWEGRRVAILASGDALFFGIGNWLNREVDPRRLRFHPHISSIQAACHALGRNRQDLEVISVHGRALETLRARLRNGRGYALFTDEASQPPQLAAELKSLGFERSRLWVCERLGEPVQRIRAFSVSDLLADAPAFDSLHVTLLDTAGMGDIVPEFPGIPDTRFHTGDSPGRGLLSKREVRVIVLSLLQPRAGELGWDIGAGCGGVAVEWARWNPRGRILAIERHAGRFHQLCRNQRRFGVLSNLTPVQARAPNCLSNRAPPGAIFIGGSDGELGQMLDYCWKILLPGGRLVTSTVTEQSKKQVLDFEAEAAGADGEWVQLAVSYGESLAGQQIMRPRLPVTLVKFVKPVGASANEPAHGPETEHRQ